MASTKRPTSSGEGPGDEGRSEANDPWIFESDPGTLPTERLPDREDFERIRAEMAELQGRPPRLFEPVAETREQPAVSTETDAIGVVPASPSAADGTEDAPSGASQAAAPAMPPSSPSGADARSGSTPSAAPRRTVPLLPPRFGDLSGWDALRDVLVVMCFVAASATALTSAWGAISMVWPRVAAGIGVLALVIVYLLRWAPTYRADYDPAKPPNLALLAIIRLVGMLPAFFVAIGVMIYDLIVSIPDLLRPLPEGPQVGVGVGVGLLLLGALVGAERRGFEGYRPGPMEKMLALRGLQTLLALALASFALSLIMMIGKAINGDLLFSLMTLARSFVALTLVVLIVRPRLNRTPGWYVFITGVAGAMAIGAAADNTLRLDYAAPASFSNAYVWLPFVLGAFGILVSRAYVRSSWLRFTRVDWVMYAARAFEFAIIMHAVALIAAVIQTIAVIAGYEGRGGVGLAITTLILLGLLLWMSVLGRSALMNPDGMRARSHAVSACVALAVLGFFGILIFSLAEGAAAGLFTGGLGLVVGIVGALMLTVPAPVRDEHGVPDLDGTFAAFRERERRTPARLMFLPDISHERAERKSFPG